jgi:DNA-binding transcriptional MocR family regulator
MVDALHAAFGSSLAWSQPRGGFFLWASLAAPLDGDTLLPLAQARGVIFVAGSAFFVSGNERRFIRLSFSSPTPERIREGVARLALAVTDAEAAVAASTAPASR